MPDLTEYGKDIKIKLIEKNKNQAWLISAIKEKCPTAYVDCSNLNKVLTGKIQSGKIITAINEILEIN